MLGTFAPQREPYVHTLDEEITPSGVLARGIYSAKLKVSFTACNYRGLSCYNQDCLSYLLNLFPSKFFMCLFSINRHISAFLTEVNLICFMQFEDDDRRCHMELKYSFEIKKSN